jgi:DNA gyrase/topoisomerase IV subunit B
MTEEFKILTPRLHVITRPGMYVGSVSLEKIDRFILGKWQTVTYVPAIIKMIDEILDNSIDEFIRSGGKHATKIDVTIEGNTIAVTDNGRGIPQDLVLDTVTGEQILRPVAAWTKTNAGTSFDDSRVTIGANGVGSACTNFLSNKFIGETWRDGNKLTVTCLDGADNILVANKKHSGTGTRVQFEPDFAHFAISNLADCDTEKLVEDRISSLQIVFPEITFTFNGKRIAANTIKKYAELFMTTDNQSVVLQQSANLSYFFVASEDGFRTTSYINGVNTRLGGTYVDFLVNGVVDELADLIKKKHKIEVAKSTIKNGLTFVMFARNFVDPKFDSQTKERLTSNSSSIKQHFDQAGTWDFNTIAKKIMQAADIIDPIVEAQLAKKLAADKRAATLAQKKLKKVKVAKHVSASSPDATLFLAEGDSAMDQLVKVRDAKLAGGFPLRGVVMNTWDMKPADVLKNKELSEMVAVLGLDINDPDSVDEMTYKNIATLSDADVDGGHIAALIVAFLYKFWPRLITENRVHITKSPIMISTDGKRTEWFYDYHTAKKFKNDPKNSRFKHRYIKGLASLTPEEYDVIINKPVFYTVSVDDPRWFDVMFGSDSQQRKDWLNGITPGIFN